MDVYPQTLNTEQTGHSCGGITLDRSVTEGLLYGWILSYIPVRGS